MMLWILYSIASRAVFLRSWREVHFRSSIIAEALGVLLYRRMTKRAARRWMASVRSICCWECGSQTVHAYSRAGWTYDLKAISLIFLEPELIFRFLLRKPKVLLAFVQTLFMCSLQFMSLLMVTPKYLALLTVSSMCPCSSYWCSGVSCCGSLAVRCTSLAGRPYPIFSPTQQAGWGLVVVGSGPQGRSPLCMQLCHPQRSEIALSRCQEGHWCKWGTSRVPGRSLVVHETGADKLGTDTADNHCLPSIIQEVRDPSDDFFFLLGCHTGWSCGSRDCD